MLRIWSQAFQLFSYPIHNLCVEEISSRIFSHFCFARPRAHEAAASTIANRIAKYKKKSYLIELVCYVLAILSTLIVSFWRMFHA